MTLDMQMIESKLSKRNESFSSPFPFSTLNLNEPNMKEARNETMNMYKWFFITEYHSIEKLSESKEKNREEQGDAKRLLFHLSGLILC